MAFIPLPGIYSIIFIIFCPPGIAGVFMKVLLTFHKTVTEPYG